MVPINLSFKRKEINGGSKDKKTGFTLTSRKWFFKNVRKSDLYRGYDLAGTGNVLWMLITAILKTEGDHSGNVLGIFK